MRNCTSPSRLRPGAHVSSSRVAEKLTYRAHGPKSSQKLDCRLKSGRLGSEVDPTTVKVFLSLPQLRESSLYTKQQTGGLLQPNGLSHSKMAEKTYRSCYIFYRKMFERFCCKSLYREFIVSPPYREYLQREESAGFTPD